MSKREQKKSLSMFEEAKTFPKMGVGEERTNVKSITLQSVTMHDRFVNTLEVDFMDIDPAYSSGTIHKQEKFLLPPERMIGIDVVHYTGLKTFIAHFPIQIFNEVWNRTPVTPYMTLDEKTVVSCKIKLKKDTSRWQDIYTIEIDVEDKREIEEV